MLIGALMLIALAAFNVRVVAADQATLSATVMLPACEPLLPVVIVTFADPRAVSSVVVFMMLSFVFAVNDPPVLLVPLDIVTL